MMDRAKPTNNNGRQALLWEACQASITMGGVIIASYELCSKDISLVAFYIIHPGRRTRGDGHIDQK